jgi:hypothetical protein
MREGGDHVLTLKCVLDLVRLVSVRAPRYLRQLAPCYMPYYSALSASCIPFTWVSRFARLVQSEVLH